MSAPLRIVLTPEEDIILSKFGVQMGKLIKEGFAGRQANSIALARSGNDTDRA